MPRHYVNLPPIIIIDKTFRRSTADSWNVSLVIFLQWKFYPNQQHVWYQFFCVFLTHQHGNTCSSETKPLCILSDWLVIFIIFSCCQWTFSSATQDCGSNVWLSSQDNPMHGSWGSEHQIVRTFHTIGSLKKCQSKASTFSCLSPTLIIILKQTWSHLASSWCKERKMSTPFYIAVKKKRGSL